MKRFMLAILIVSAVKCIAALEDVEPVRAIGLPATDGIVSYKDFVATIDKHKDTVVAIGITTGSETTRKFSPREMLNLIDILNQAPNLRAI